MQSHPARLQTMERNTVARALPHADQAEKALLSLCLQEPDHIARLLEAGVVAKTFYVPAHGLIFSHLADLYEADQSIELISFTKRLEDHGHLTNVGGPAEISAIYSFTPTSAHFDRHLELLIDTSRRRETILYAARLSSAAYDESEEGRYQDMLLQGADDIVEASRSENGAISGSDAVSTWRSGFEAKRQGLESDIRSSGISCLDGLRGGIDYPGLTYVGALPSTGKTALWVQMMCHRLRHIIEADLDESILFFTLEMTPTQVITRAIIHLAGLEDPRMITDPASFDLSWEEEDAIDDAARILSDERLRIVDCAGVSIAEMEARAKLEAKRRPLGLIGVDYVQRVPGPEDGVEQRMMKISAGLQRMWKRHRCSVVGLSQLTETKEGETRLKYAEALEEDADLSIRIERKKDEDRVTGLYITKDRHRGFRFHRLKCHFDKYRQRFYTPEI